MTGIQYWVGQKVRSGFSVTSYGKTRTNILANPTVGDFNTPLTSMDRSSRERLNKATEILNDTIAQLDLIDIFMTLHPKKPEYTFFSSAHGTFSRIDHILGHKTSLNKFRSTEII